MKKAFESSDKDVKQANTEMNQVKFSDDQMLAVEDYNPFSIMALLVCLFAVMCCVLAVFNHKLIGLPFLSAIAAIAAIYALHAGNMARGHYLAGFALCASMFTFSMAVSYQTMRYKHLEAKAIEHGETWLNLVKAGQIYEAHEMTLEFEKRHAEGSDLTQFYGPVDQPDLAVAEYLDVQPEKSIREIGENAKIRRGDIAYERPYSIVDRFEIHYYLDRSATGEDDFHFTIMFLRTKPLVEDIYWEIEGLVNVEPPTPRSGRRIGAVGGQKRQAEK
jgi:hypothetical protein